MLYCPSPLLSMMMMSAVAGLLLNFLQVVVCMLVVMVSSHSHSHSHNKIYTPPSVPHLTDLFTHVPFDEGFSTSFGAQNVNLFSNAYFANLKVDNTSGCGMVSKTKTLYGFFSAKIKLPSGLTSGVVVALYLSNSDVYPHNHDEIDIELLGHDKRNNWVLQTNVYANGSVRTGREEKFYLWFDPTSQYHYYSLIWNKYHTVFLVDNIPVREFIHTTGFPYAYPSKPMALYATIWDGSDWATHGGKYGVDYKYSPFVASFTDMQTTSCCLASSTTVDPVQGQEFVKLSAQQSLAMDWARRKLMFYSYCKDTHRYKVMPPECK